MRILTVGNMFPPHHLGGYELVWESSVSHLLAGGHAVRTLTTNFKLADAGPDAEQTDVHRELWWYWRDHDFPRPTLLDRWRLERHNAAVLDRHLVEFRPDVVAWWAMGGMSLSSIERVRWAGIPAVGVVCDDWLLYAPRVDAWTRMFSSRPRAASLVERATGIPTSSDIAGVRLWLFPSEATRSAARASGCELGETEVCHQGVDPRLFPPAPEAPWDWRLLYVGRIDPRKGIELAVRALADCPPEATLTVAGGGDDVHMEQLRTLAGKLGLEARVTFTQRPRDRLVDLYAGADSLLFPVLWSEPWGLVPLEAMSVGTPVIASGRGGSGEYLRDEENCLIFDPDSGAGALAESIRRLAADPALRAHLRERGFETAGRFSEDAFNSAVERTLQRAVTREG